METVEEPRPALTARDVLDVVVGDARELLVNTSRLLVRYWYLLLAIAALGATLRFWVLDLAVVVAGGSATAGLAVFALSPGIAFATAVGMLAVTARLTGARGGSVASTLAAFASALLLYLVLYEQSGQLETERGSYFRALFHETVFSGETGPSDGIAGRIPDGLSVPMLATIVVAFVLRGLGARVLERHDARGTPPTRLGGIGTATLRTLVAYAELIWLVLSFLVIAALVGRLGDWWESRRVVVGVSERWAELHWPVVAPSIGAAAEIVGHLVQIAVVGIVVPTAWLALGFLLHGRREGAGEPLARRAAAATAAYGTRLGARSRRLAVVDTDRLLDADRLERSWSSVLRPESRWGPLGGAVALVLARGWLPVLTFAIILSVLSQVDRVVWWLADLLLPTVALADWGALYPVVAALGQIVTQTVTIAVVAAGTDLTLRRLGMPGVLRLPPRSQARRTAAATAPEPETRPQPAPVQPTQSSSASTANDQ